MLQLSPGTLMRRARAGVVPGARIGRRWVFVRADLLAAAKALPQRPPPTPENVKRNMRLDTKRLALRPKLAEYFSWHRASRARRTPAWADREKIREIYRTAQYLTETTGIPHHVDHEIPLHGKAVSGLHIETNLRVIPARANQSKGNR